MSGKEDNITLILGEFVEITIKGQDWMVCYQGLTPPHYLIGVSKYNDWNGNYSPTFTLHLAMHSIFTIGEKAYSVEKDLDGLAILLEPTIKKVD